MDPPDWLHVNEQRFGRKHTDSGTPGINRHIAYAKMHKNTPQNMKLNITMHISKWSESGTFDQMMHELLMQTKK